uniref:Uncharacterized protein n=1 Tax=Anguilla anguilla TaxID=7936 RepID=A0A0E9QVS5_ANGAN
MVCIFRGHDQNVKDNSEQECIMYYTVILQLQACKTCRM